MANAFHGVIHLKFAMRGPIDLQQIIALRDNLHIRGHATSLLDRVEGGIDFVTDATPGRRDVRWGSGQQGLHPSIHQLDSTGNFCKPLDFVVFLPAANEPIWHQDNVFNVRCTWQANKPFTQAEITDIRCSFTQSMRLVDNVIYNRAPITCRTSSLPEETDSNYDCNMFANFEFRRALADWTIPSEDWPDEMIERLFRCWKCQEHRPYGHFINNGNFMDNLELCVWHNARCCRTCLHTLTVCHDPQKYRA